MAKRNLYLNVIPVEEALERYLSVIKERVAIKTETIPVIRSLGRVTVSAIYAKYNSPLYNSAAMDGIAVVAGKTTEASDVKPLVLQKGEYVIVDTGDPIHEPYDAVIMAENLIETADGEIQITEPAMSWQHIRPVGEDIVAHELILTSNHKIRPMDIGVLLSAGITEIEVYKQINVAIFATGTEIIEPDQNIEDGSIIESNSRMFEGLVTEQGAKAHRQGILKDDYALIRDKVKEACDKYDMVIVNAGSSAGTEDFTVHVLRELGEVFVHGVAIKPGKPVILAMVGNTPVVGLPGYPVSAYICYQNFVRPLINYLQNSLDSNKEIVEAYLSKRLISSLKHKEYVRVKVGKVEDKIIATPLARGAGAAMSLVRADGFCVIEQNQEGIEAGEKVHVELCRSVDEIENTVVSIGSHDLILDVLADMIPNKFSKMHISSSHVGSMAGLMALKRGEAHIAPIHLLDEETGSYNIAIIKKLFGNTGKHMALIKGVKRVQGFIVPKGNPKHITEISDVTKCRYVNRQVGSGTRVLFDYLLKKNGIASTEVNGYDKEIATHMAVAALVQSGSVDCGMGIESAARAMDLNFVPVGHEEYDFAIEEHNLALPHVKAFIEILKSAEFQEKVLQLGGYECTHCGEIVQVL